MKIFSLFFGIGITALLSLAILNHLYVRAVKSKQFLLFFTEFLSILAVKSSH